MKLYSYYRSSASYRVRIALRLKQVNYDLIPVHLLNQGGEQYLPDYRVINPQSLVPTLDDHGYIITQSLAIIEYLNERYPNPPLLPATAEERALIRSLALQIACEIHPLNNLRVLNQLRQQFHATDDAVTTWYHHWLKQGFDALETRLSQLDRTKPVCYGEQISLADLCLIPQVYNARRFNFSLDNYPMIQAIDAYCLGFSEFQEDPAA